MSLGAYPRAPRHASQIPPNEQSLRLSSQRAGSTLSQKARNVPSVFPLTVSLPRASVMVNPGSHDGASEVSSAGEKLAG